MTEEHKLAIDNAWRIHAALVDWTGKVDSKASFASALLSASLIAIIALAGGDRRLAHLEGFSLVALWIGVWLLVLALFLVVYAVSPKIRQKNVIHEWQENFVFFGHVKFWKPDALAKALETHDILPVLTRQLRVMSIVAWKKHQFVRWGLILAGAGLLMVGLAAATRGDVPLPSPAPI